MSEVSFAETSDLTAMPIPQHDDLDISDIEIGERYRKEIGDVTLLAESIKANGLFNPVTISNDNKLVAGERRIRAFQHLGWSRIPVRRVNIDSIVRGEHDENEIRKDFTPSERVAIAAEVERKMAERRGRDNPQNIAELKGMETRQIAAEKAGFGNRETLRQAKVVVATNDNELIEAMDTGKVAISTAALATKLEQEERKQALSQPDPNKALREAVVAMATARPSTPSNKNPIYKPNAQFNALAAVTGFCDSITEKIENNGIAYLVGGVVDDAMKAREKATINRCIENLHKLAEVL